jgi:hypothetical protein
MVGMVLSAALLRQVLPTAATVAKRIFFSLKLYRCKLGANEIFFVGSCLLEEKRFHLVGWSFFHTLRDLERNVC